MSQRLWIESGRTSAIHNARDIIDDGSIYNIPGFMDCTRRGCAIYNLRNIIDEEPIYNVPRIMDWKQREERHS
jgi:hypothetical protein